MDVLTRVNPYLHRVRASFPRHRWLEPGQAIHTRASMPKDACTNMCNRFGDCR